MWRKIDNFRDDQKRTQAYKKIIKGDPCVYCGIRPGTTKDHIQPKSNGGLSSWTNYAPACGPCNRAKGSLELLDYLLFRLERNDDNRS